MTKKNPKKPLRSRNRNPKRMTEEEEEEEKSPLPKKNRNPAEMIQIEESPLSKMIQNPTETIEVVQDEIQEEVQIQNPKPIQVEEEETLRSDDTTCQNPKLIEEEEEEGKSHSPNQNIEMIEVEEETQEEVQNQNPKTIEKETLKSDETTQQTLKLIEGEEESQPSHNEEKQQENDHDDHQNHIQEEEDEEAKPEPEEPEGMDVSPSRSPSAQESPMRDFIPENPSPTASNHQQTEGKTLYPMLPSASVHDCFECELVSENPPRTIQSKDLKKKKKTGNQKQKKPLNHKQRAAMEKKLELISGNLQPIPFVPIKTLDFSKHEKLFKRLGLWDFVHMEFDREIRSDLLAQLIVNYNPALRCSWVNDTRLKVSRADLGRALKLPLKKDKIIPPVALDLDPEVLSEESISFLDEFVSNWILLHEDMWMMPEDVLTYTRYIKEGQPEKVDWPGLIWFMVEKELSQATKLESCYYASHLQCLIWAKKDMVLKEEPGLEASMGEGQHHADVKICSLEDFQGQELEQQPVELTLGQERNDDEQQVRDEDVMDFQACKEPGDSSQWFLDGKNNFEEHCLRRCNNVDKNDDLDDQCVVKEEQEEQEEERYDLSSKCSLDGLASNDLLQGMGTTNIPYIPSMQLLDDNSVELLQTRTSTHINQGGPSLFSNTFKRELRHEEEDDFRDHIFSGPNKRMKNTDSWENKAPDFEYCMEQINSWMGKARMMYRQKEEACMNAHMNQDFLVSQLQERDNMIANLHKTNCEEIHKREGEMYKLENELRIMSNLLEGYRRALKQTQRAFSEYRELFPQPDEPLYKDVPGSGGLVLSTMELEKQRLEREEEVKMQRTFFGEMMKNFERSCFARLEASWEKVHLLDTRLLELDEEIKVLKEISAKHKMPEAQGCIANEV